MRFIRHKITIGLFLGAVITIMCQGAIASEPDTLYIKNCYQKGSSYYSSYPDSALYYFHLCLQHYKNTDFNTIPGSISTSEQLYYETIIKANNDAGNICYFDDQYFRAEQYYRSSLSIAQKTGMTDYVALSFFDLGYVFYVTSHYLEAQNMFNSALSIWEQENNKQDALETLSALGLTHRRLGDFVTSDSCYIQALQYAEEIEDSIHIYDIRTNRGILLCENGKLEEGMAQFQDALEFYMSQGNKAAVSSTYLNIGKVMTFIGEDSSALEYFSKSIEIEEALQRKSQLILPYFSIGELYLDMGNTEKGYEYCKKIRILSDEIGTKPYMAECDFLEGRYHFLNSDYSKAQKFFERAADSAVAKNNKPLMVDTKLWCSKAYLNQDHNIKALLCAKVAWDIAGEMDMIIKQKEAAEIISTAYENRFRYSEALQWNKQYHAHSDSLRIFNQQKEINRIEARYNYEKKEQENEILRNKTLIQEQKLKTRNIFGMALIIGIILAILIILLMIRRSRDSKIMYHQQQMINLHELEDITKKLDGKERELASKMMFLNQKNEMINRLIERLQQIQNSDNGSTIEIKSIVNELRIDSPQSNWKEFELQFNRVHPDFYKRLYEKHPDLSSYEQRVCAFLRMNLNTKEISSITGRSHKSIEVTRSRIRKKLNLTRKDNLSNFLASV